MARRLVITKLLFGSMAAIGLIELVLPTLSSPMLCAATPQPPSGTATPPLTSDKIHDGDRHRDDDKRRDDARRDDRPDARRGRGSRGGGMYRIIFEAVRRDGGPLELMPLMMNKGVREHIQTSDDLNTKFEAYLADMQKRVDEERKQAEGDPNTDWPKLFKDRLEKENAEFHKFLSAMPAPQQDRLIGIFIQHRNLRSLGNRVVAVDRLGMSPPEAAKLQTEINAIREETMRESNEEMQRIFSSGGDRPDQASIQQLVRKNQAKIDSRIEKLVDKVTLDKLKALRGAELPKDLLETLDAPPRPSGPPPGSR